MSRDMTETNKVSVRPAKTQVSLGICPVWSESSLSTWRNLGPLATQWADSEVSDQTGRVPRLIWVFAGCTLILLVLSCHNSNVLQDFRSHALWKWLCQNTKWARARQNQKNDLCSQQRHWSAWALPSLISLHCSLEKGLGPKLTLKCTAKTLIGRLGGCWGWSESSLEVILRLKCFWGETGNGAW